MIVLQELSASTRTKDADVHAWSYTYDPIGNRAQATDDPPGTASDVLTYAANNLNQYTRVTLDASGSQGSLNPAYDADSNLEREFAAGDADCDGDVDFFDIDPFVARLGCPTSDPVGCNAGCPWQHCDVDGDGDVDFFDIDAFVAALGWNCSTPGWPFLCPCSNFDADQDGDVDFFDIDAFMARLGQSNVTREFGWDAENRLIGVTPTVDPNNVPTPLPKKVTYVYDYLGRRVERKVFLWNTSGRAWSTTASEHTRYVWGGAAPSGGWLLLMELNASNQAVKKYTWGLDLAGQAGAGTGAGVGAGGPASGRSSSGFLESAGGIGGLLAVEDLDDGAVAGDPAGSFLFCYDGNGNVGQLVDWSAANVTAALVAKYEYDPYGALIGPDTNQDGVFDPAVDLTATARANPFRFSTKQWDDATGLGYWGYRYYSAMMGRWVSRDPIEESGGAHLYRYSRGCPVSAWDARGLVDEGAPPWPPGHNPFRDDQRPREVGPGGSCKVELRCNAPIFLGQRHCDYFITSSAGGTGQCICGPTPCPKPCWFYVRCIFDCNSCAWVSLGDGALSSAGSTVDQVGNYPESVCECLRSKCKGYKPLGCYGLGDNNSNTAAACLNSGCAMGFTRPGGAFGWPEFFPGANCPGMP